MVCSYFLDASFNRDLFFRRSILCRSLPLSKILFSRCCLTIRSRTKIRARPIATRCCCPPDNWLGKWLRRSFRLRTVSSSSRYFLSGGSGKSTLLNMIGALDTPTSGKVTIGGKDIFSMNDRKLTVFRRRNIGFIFQAFNLVPELTRFHMFYRYC